MNQPEPSGISRVSPEDPSLARRPVLLTSQRSAVLLNRRGELRCLRESRGGEIDWGGVYSEGVRLTGPWEVRLAGPDGSIPISSATESLVEERWGVRSRHRTATLVADQELQALEEPPGVGRRLLLSSTTGRPVDVTVELEFAPFLAPVLIEGVKPYVYRARTRGPRVIVATHGYSLALDSDPLPSRLALNGRPWIGGRFEGELTSLRTDFDVRVPSAGTSSLCWVTWGGLERTVEGDPELGLRALERRETWEAERRRIWEGWLGSIPKLSLPDAPRVEEAFRRACEALYSLYTRPEPTMTGLVAGFPWYSAIWCRDLAWMLPAVLWMGDFARVEEALRTVFRYQARADLPVLGATAGELPMQLSPGPVFLFGTSDTTLHYPTIVRR
ncbi:MAG: hypothetical protein L3K09_03645, partial [Thermoplasmata archaeon]|nr:hypothetical protein [Thermoplasmata archaeon]